MEIEELNHHELEAVINEAEKLIPLYNQYESIAQFASSKYQAQLDEHINRIAKIKAGLEPIDSQIREVISLYNEALNPKPKEPPSRSKGIKGWLSGFTSAPETSNSEPQRSRDQLDIERKELLRHRDQIQATANDAEQKIINLEKSFKRELQATGKFHRLIDQGVSLRSSVKVDPIYHIRHMEVSVTLDNQELANLKARLQNLIEEEKSKRRKKLERKQRARNKRKDREVAKSMREDLIELQLIESTGVVQTKSDRFP